MSCPIDLAPLAPNQWDQQATENEGLVSRTGAEINMTNFWFATPAHDHAERDVKIVRNHVMKQPIKVLSACTVTLRTLQPNQKRRT